jgi:hypothetical protein
MQRKIACVLDSLNDSDSQVNVRLKRRECCGQKCEREEELGNGRNEEVFALQMEREVAGSPDSSQILKKQVKRRKRPK